MTDTLYRWVKASERIPVEMADPMTIVWRQISTDRTVKVWSYWTKEKFELDDADLLRKPVGTLVDKSDLEWLEPYAPSVIFSIPGKAAKEYAENDENHNDTAFECVKAAFLAGAAYSSSELDRMGKLCMEKDGEIEKLLNEKAEEFDMKRLYDWIMDENRKGATTFFTSGWLRNVAKEIEFRINEVKQVTNDMNTLAKMESESMGWLVEKEKQLKALPDELRKKNPFSNPAYHDFYNQGYLNACSKLEELLNQSK